MSCQTVDYVRANQHAWSASAAHHVTSDGYKALKIGFAQPGFLCFDDILKQHLVELGIAGKDVCQLCCNNGRELISLGSLGAHRLVGFDQAGAFLEQGRELAAIAGRDCRFIETDIYAVSEEYDASFDLALVTTGSIGWMPDLVRFMGVATRLLQVGGVLLIYEQHPIMNMYDPLDPIDPHRRRHSYFRGEPFEESGAIVYDGRTGLEGPIKYWFLHPLGDIVTAAIESGLAIEILREYPHNICNAEFDIYDVPSTKLPQSYVLAARKVAVTRS